MRVISLMIGLVGLSLSVIQAHAATTYFYEDFSDNSAGWTTDIEWTIQPAMASSSRSGGFFGDPGTDRTPTADNGIAGVIIGGDALISLHPYRYITSPTIDVTGVTTLYLNFFRWLNSDYAPFMQNTVDVFDGVQWVTVWQSGGAPGIADSAWTLQQFDVSVYANALFAMRFGHQVGSSGAFTVSGWNIDDVSLTSAPVPLPGGIWLLGTAMLGLLRLRQAAG